LVLSLRGGTTWQSVGYSFMIKFIGESFPYFLFFKTY
jgi:hypothetical protein